MIDSPKMMRENRVFEVPDIVIRMKSRIKSILISSKKLILHCNYILHKNCPALNLRAGLILLKKAYISSISLTLLNVADRVQDKLKGFMERLIAYASATINGKSNVNLIAFIDAPSK